MKARVLLAGWLTLASCAPAAGVGVTPSAADPSHDGGRERVRDANAAKVRAEAQALHRIVRGDGDEDRETRKIAQFRLAMALHALGFVNGAYGIFSEIAADASHPKYTETLLWLAKIATELPEPADVGERLDRYGDAALARFDNPAQATLHGEVQYLRGRYLYRNAQYPQAIAALLRIRAGTPHYARAHVLAGIAHVQLRNPAAAVRSWTALGSLRR